MIPRLGKSLWFPDPLNADGPPYNGLVAVGGDLSVPRLVLAYRSGIYPWSVDPITWWSPDPRGILELDDFHVPRSLARVLKQNPYRFTLDRAFGKVIEACAYPPRRGSWISPEFIRAYAKLHEAGVAHSVECWKEDDLVGGIYGVAVGGLFAGESMFHHADHASKLALHYLVEHLKSMGFRLLDIQMVTPVTQLLGATQIARTEYLRRLKRVVDLPCKFLPKPTDSSSDEK